MNNKKFAIFLPYIITLITTMIIIFSLALISEISLLWRSEKKIISVELSKQIFSKFHTIDELEKYIVANPNDYKAHIKLAQKYNEINEYNSANAYYQSALKISERSNYSLYAYSLFCIEQKLYNLALNMAEEISLYNKKAIKYKAVIYEKIAMSLDKDGEIEGSIKAYQVALKYAKGTYVKQDLDELKLNYAKEYIKLADIKIEKKEAKSAILDINNSIRIKETPIAKYKLALIYKDINKQKSEKLMANILDENPYLVNPYIYNSLLNELIDEARMYGHTGKINYYNSKINSYNKLLSKIYVFKDDINISNIDIYPKKSKLFGKENIYLRLDIDNETKNEITDLFLLIELYYGNNKLELNKKIASKTNILGPGEKLTNIEIKFPPDFTRDNITLANDLILKFYTKKQKNAPWALIKIQQLK